MSENPLGAAQSQEDRFQAVYDAGEAPEKPDDAVEAAQAAPEAAPEAPAVEAPEYESFDDLLAKSNLERDSVYELPLTVKVDGKVSQVKLAELVNQYQFSATNTQKAQAIAEQARALEAEKTQAQQTVAYQLSTAKALGDLAQQTLMQEYQNVNWAQLRMDNPAEWSAKQQEFNLRAQSIDQHLRSVEQARQQQLQEQQNQLATKVLPVERQKMLEVRPEWSDPNKFKAAQSRMGDLARKFGFSDAEINNVFDHRYMLILDMASQFAALQAKQAQAVNRVRTAPVMAQPGARTSRDPNAAALQNAKEAVRKNPRDQDAQARLFSSFT